MESIQLLKILLPCSLVAGADFLEKENKAPRPREVQAEIWCTKRHPLRTCHHLPFHSDLIQRAGSPPPSRVPTQAPRGKEPCGETLRVTSLLPPKLAPGNGSTPPSERNQGAGSLSRALRLQDHTRTGRGHLRPLNRGRLSAHGLPEQEQDRASAGSHSAIISFLSSFFSPR